VLWECSNNEEVVQVKGCKDCDLLLDGLIPSLAANPNCVCSRGYEGEGLKWTSKLGEPRCSMTNSRSARIPHHHGPLETERAESHAFIR
jgi:hypothetical protein